MTIKQFIDSEKDYLYKESQQFVERYPLSSQFLGEKNTDPDLNRVLDGFTFFTGLLNAKFDKELPELTFSLMNVLWPHYLQQTPSFTIMRFSIKDDVKPQGCYFVKKNQQVTSRKKNRHTPACTFSLTRDTCITPFTITQCDAIATDQLRLTFTSPYEVKLNASFLNDLIIYCGHDIDCGYLMYLWLNEHLIDASITIDHKKYPLPDLDFHPQGFADQENTLPIYHSTFDGYRLIHEYFCYPEGYLFLRPNSQTSLLNGIQCKEFSLNLTFDRPFPQTCHFSTHSFQTNCVPAINLFNHDCEPIRITGYKNEYPLYINHQYPEHFEVFSISEVKGWTQGQSRTYSLFENFHHQLALQKGRIPLYYHLNRKPKLNSDLIYYSLAFIRGDEDHLLNKDEIISINAICSNQNQAQRLREGEINIIGEGIPDTLSCENINHPSKVMRPLLDKRQEWMAISSLSLNYLSLDRPDSLHQLLKNYNITACYSERAALALNKLIDGISSIKTESCSIPYEALYIDGYKSTIVVSPQAFYNEGEMYLFGTTLAHFYSQYATVNSFHILEILNSSTNEVFTWTLKNH